MKFVVLVIDGAADSPNPSLGGRTPLEAAVTPNLDRLASRGTVGLVRTIPDKMPAGSEIGNLAILGYDPKFHASGRAASEAAGMGISLGPGDLAFRCNLVTLRDVDRGYGLRDFGTDLILDDYSGGEIRSDESGVLIRGLNRAVGSESIQFYPGLDYRHLLVLRGASGEFRRGIGPHDIRGERIGPHLPEDPVLLRLMKDAAHLFFSHPVNARRIGRGLRPANGIWLWGEGRAKVLPSFQSRFGLSGATLSAVDLVRGIGCSVGMEPIFVPGATGRLDSDFGAKADAALRALEKRDLVFLHVEAADEAAHRGCVSDKVAAIERFDRDIVGRLVLGLSGEISGGGSSERAGGWRILVVPDHSTSTLTGAHGSEPVPFLIAGSGDFAGPFRRFTEAEGKRSGVLIAAGQDLMPRFLEKGPRWP